ncbi:hypothetical protein [Hyphomicrobium sp. ghe19]|uniref:hypothetical protein n=1 Tax=Hyphomicrobium sp. ghe19 TaxID=2682968 RepID=UPI0030CAF5F3
MTTTHDRDAHNLPRLERALLRASDDGQWPQSAGVLPTTKVFGGDEVLVRYAERDRK